jgi:hypothetical protein
MNATHVSGKTLSVAEDFSAITALIWHLHLRMEVQMLFLLKNLSTIQTFKVPMLLTEVSLSLFTSA